MKIDVITDEKRADLTNDNKHYIMKLRKESNAQIILTPAFNKKYLNEFANNDERPIPPLSLLSVIALEDIQENEPILINYQEQGSNMENINYLSALLHEFKTDKKFSSNDEPNYKAIVKELNNMDIISEIRRKNLLQSDRKYLKINNEEDPEEANLEDEQ